MNITPLDDKIVFSPGDVKEDFRPVGKAFESLNLVNKIPLSLLTISFAWRNGVEITALPAPIA